MSLEDLYNQLRNKQSELSNHERKRQQYLDKGSQCNALYKRVLADKQAVEGYLKSVKTLRNEDFSDFKGHQHSKVYKPAMKELMEAYDDLIDNLDTNADRLNSKRVEWENKAYALDGPIGKCRSAINYIWSLIQNWTN